MVADQLTYKPAPGEDNCWCKMGCQLLRYDYMTVSQPVFLGMLHAASFACGAPPLEAKKIVLSKPHQARFICK